MPNSILQTICYHCGDKCKDTTIQLEDKWFCCNGCKSVYQLLSKNNLCAYYDLNEHAGISIKQEIRNEKFEYLDNQDIQQQLIQYKDDKQTHVTFFLPQIHCSSCLYLLEHIQKINDNVISSKINFNKKELFLVFNHQQLSLRQVVELLSHLGYEPHISLQKNKDNAPIVSKSKIYKVGVAGFCFANIMLLSFPEYFSQHSYIEENLKDIFKYLSFALSLPVITYSASEFYATAWSGIKNKYLNIDVPVVLAVILTFLRSIYELAFTDANGYFDSMSGLVFFMLIGRIAQDKTYQYLSFERDYKSFFPIAVNKLFDTTYKPVQIEQVQEGDVIQVFANEIVPVDAIVSKGNAEIDYSFVSGESIPVVINKGELVYAGGKQLTGSIELVVVKTIQQSYLTNLWNQHNDAHKTKSNLFVDSLSKYFTLVILTIGLLTCIYWATQHQITTGLNALTTILIVACPCTLLLASSFTYGNMMRILAKNKLYLRQATILEQFNKIDTIVYDKTGTLTHSNEINTHFVGATPTTQIKSYIVSLAAQSKHPYSKAIVSYWDIPTQPIEHFKEVLGYGTEAWIDEHYIKMGSASFFNLENPLQQSVVYVAIDNQLIGHFIFSNVYRTNFATNIKALASTYQQYILSGDTTSEQQFLSDTLGSSISLHFNQKPDDKLKFIKHLQQKQHKIIMIGDGLNDAGALQQSNIGIAIAENNNNFTPACDAILDANSLALLPKIVTFAKYGKRVIIISFMFSFIYNVVGLSFCIKGNLSPLIAAILMPLSSISIIVITFSLSQLAAWHLKLLKHDKSHISI